MPKIAAFFVGIGPAQAEPMKRRVWLPTALLLFAACDDPSVPLELSERAGEAEPLPDVTDGLDYSTYAKFEQERHQQLASAASDILAAGLVEELGLDEEAVYRGDYGEEELMGLQDKLSAYEWEPGHMEDVLPWAKDASMDHEEYWDNAGHPEVAQQTQALSGCAELGNPGGLINTLEARIDTKTSSHLLLPVNRLGGAELVVSCRAVAPMSGWSPGLATIPGPRGQWRSMDHDSDSRFTLYAPRGTGTDSNVHQVRTRTTAFAANIFLDATQNENGGEYTLLCDAESGTKIDGELEVQGAATYCIDIEVRPPEDPCEGARPIEVELKGPDRPMRPGEAFKVEAEWDIPQRYSDAGCNDRGNTTVTAYGGTDLLHMSSKGIGGAVGGRTVPVGHKTEHWFQVSSSNVSDRSRVKLQLRDDPGPGASDFKVRDEEIWIDIISGPEFGTTRGSTCGDYDYCWTFSKQIGPMTYRSPNPGESFTNGFRVTNHGNETLLVTAGPSSGNMYTVTSSASRTILPRNFAGWMFPNYADYNVQFETPTESQLPNKCRRSGTRWMCEEELTFATNDGDPEHQQVTVLLQTPVIVRDGLVVIDQWGAELPDTVDFGEIALGETELVEDSGSPQMEMCPDGHFLRHLQIRNEGVWARTNAQIYPTDPANEGGAFVLNAVRSAGLNPNDTMDVDICILPKEAGLHQETLEIWQNSYPHAQRDITFRWEAVEPLGVSWSSYPTRNLVDEDELDFGVLFSALSSAPTDFGQLHIVNQTDRELAISARATGGSTWSMQGDADAVGTPFNPAYHWLLYPGESMDYGIDLNDITAGQKTGGLRVSWGDPTSISGRRVLGLTPDDSLEVDVSVLMQ